MTQATASVVGSRLGKLSTRLGTRPLMCVGAFLLMSPMVLGVVLVVHSVSGKEKEMMQKEKRKKDQPRLAGPGKRKSLPPLHLCRFHPAMRVWGETCCFIGAVQCFASSSTGGRKTCRPLKTLGYDGPSGLSNRREWGWLRWGKAFWGANKRNLRQMKKRHRFDETDVFSRNDTVLDFGFCQGSFKRFRGTSPLKG